MWVGIGAYLKPSPLFFFSPDLCSAYLTVKTLLAYKICSGISPEPNREVELHTFVVLAPRRSYKALHFIGDVKRHTLPVVQLFYTQYSARFNAGHDPAWSLLLSLVHKRRALTLPKIFKELIYLYLFYFVFLDSQPKVFFLKVVES